MHFVIVIAIEFIICKHRLISVTIVKYDYKDDVSQETISLVERNNCIDRCLEGQKTIILYLINIFNPKYQAVFIFRKDLCIFKLIIWVVMSPAEATYASQWIASSKIIAVVSTAQKNQKDTLMFLDRA